MNSSTVNGQQLFDSFDDVFASKPTVNPAQASSTEPQAAETSLETMPQTTNLQNNPVSVSDETISSQTLSQETTKVSKLSLKRKKNHTPEPINPAEPALDSIEQSIQNPVEIYVQPTSDSAPIAISDTSGQPETAPWQKDIDSVVTSRDQYIKPELDVMALRSMRHNDLVQFAELIGVDNPHNMRKAKLIHHIVKIHIQQRATIFAQGWLEVVSDGYGFLRDHAMSFGGDESIYIPTALIRRFNLKSGLELMVHLRLPQGDKERYLTASRVVSIQNQDPEANRKTPNFEEMTPLHPQRVIHLERSIRASENITGRLLDLISPIGFGQRALIVAPPKSGKTVMMQHLAHAIAQNHPEAHLMVLLIDERPEEVTEMERTVSGEVFSSTFDEPAERHVAVAEMVIERAKRLVEMKKDVIILMDSITRLARAYNTIAPNSGKMLSGGVEAQALTRPKRFFGAARCLEEGGSLTIIGTTLVDTGSRMDEVIYEEFKGTGNMEVHLDRRLTERRVFPAVNVAKSGTRREELLLDEQVLSKIWMLRKVLHDMDDATATEFLLDKLRQTKNNDEFLDQIKRN